ncbi:ankyrin repeat domain-containing protein [Photobacterium sp. BZF1]|uniref:ankyrin repeat domain-containing protein n=1 Tax=Photobacterium sp. BZF1 TaxID=1904457 RepID=UPI001653A213|nr:ankyrin repeat domain-containing protein [Photobacterium sp. BZF1]MBC7006089.1 ankyrin repeat domain-containing protein [Photobacterium sp. BZF1]
MKKKLLATLATAVIALTVSYGALCNDTIHLAAYHGDEAQVIELLKLNPNPDERDSYGGTALHAAMFQDNVQIVQLLIDAGYDVNAVGPRNGYTPLHDAVWGNNLPALKLLVENGGDVTIKGHDGNTPLTKAREEGKQDIVAYLESL